MKISLPNSVLSKVIVCPQHSSINDLAEHLKGTNCGVISIGMCNIHCLLYADNIALIAASEEDLQNMSSILENWCKKW